MFFHATSIVVIYQVITCKKKEKDMALIIIETTIAIISFDEIINKDIYQYLINLFYIFRQMLRWSNSNIKQILKLLNVYS